MSNIASAGGIFLLQQRNNCHKRIFARRQILLRERDEPRRVTSCTIHNNLPERMYLCSSRAVNGHPGREIISSCLNYSDIAVVSQMHMEMVYRTQSSPWMKT